MPNGAGRSGGIDPPHSLEDLAARLADARREIEEVRGVADALVLTLQGVIGALDVQIPGVAGRLHGLLSRAHEETPSGIWPGETSARTRARERLRTSLRDFVQEVANRATTPGLRGAFSARCQKLLADIESVLGFRPKTFDGKDAVDVARGLVLGKTSSVFERLREKNRLDLTIEHIILNEPEWAPLFEDAHRARAAARLAGDR